MRGLLHAVLRVPTLLISAFFISGANSDVERTSVDGIATTDRLAVTIPLFSSSHASSPDSFDGLSFWFEVQKSEFPCGYGNITIDGQTLPQTISNETSWGKGPVEIKQGHVIVASWKFHCIKSDGEQAAQLLNFAIDSVDGVMVENVGVKILFKQADTPDVMSIVTNLSIPGHVATDLNQCGFHPIGKYSDATALKHGLAELEGMRAQLQELKFLIKQKEKAFANQSHHSLQGIKHCDSLVCIGRFITGKTHHAAHKILEKLQGKGEYLKQPSDRDFKKARFPGNSFYNGNERHCIENHINSKLPCLIRPCFTIPMWQFPPRHGQPSGEQNANGRQRPLPEAPLPHLDKQLDSTGQPTHSYHRGKVLFSKDQETVVFPWKSAREELRNRHEVVSPQQPLAQPREHLYHHAKAFHIIKLVLVGTFVSIVCAVLHRRIVLSPKKRLARRARKEERRQRRLYRREAHRQAINRFLVRVGCRRSDEKHIDYQEKLEAFPPDYKGRIQTTMTEDIIEFRNAAALIGDLVASDERGSRPINISRSHTHDFDLESQVEDGRELPAYEDSEDSGDGIANGFMPTPSSTEYASSQPDRNESESSGLDEKM